MMDQDAAQRLPFMVFQLDPGHRDYRLYTLYWSEQSTPLGQVLVPNTASGDFQPGQEYWYMSENMEPEGETSLTFSWTDYAWGEGPIPSGAAFLLPQPLEFEGPQTPEQAPTLFSLVNPGNPQQVFALSWLLVGSAGDWGGNLDWYATTQSWNPFTDSSSSGSLLFKGDQAVLDTTWWVDPGTVKMP